MDRFTWSIAALALVLVVFAVGSVAVLQGTTSPPDLSRPEGVVRAYVEALDANHPERAWDLLGTSARGRTTRDEFIRRATSFGHRPEVRVAIDRVEIQGDTALVQLSRSYNNRGLFGPSTSTSRVTVRLEREGGLWKITVPPDPYLIETHGPPVSGPPPVAATPAPPSP